MARKLMRLHRTSRVTRLRAARWSAALLAALSPLVASAAIAPVVIDYRSDVACPDEAVFLAAVRAQTPNLTPPPAGGAARTISIEILAENDTLLGRLRVDELDGTSSVREVIGHRCDDIVSALALFTALTIDSGPVAPRAPAPAAPPKLTPPPALALPAARPSVPFPRVGLGVLAGAFGGLAPVLAGGVEPFFDWSTWSNKSGFSPSLRFAVAFAASPTTATPAGSVTFLWLVARASACPVALTLGPVTARPCSGIDAGILHGQGGDIAHPASSTRPWIAPTIAARAQWAVTTSIHLETEGGLAIPLIRDRFVLDTPPIDAHTTPPIAGFASVGIGFLLGAPASPRFP